MSLPGEPEVRHDLHSQKDRLLQELEKQGYVAEALAGPPGAAMYRHPVAPSLLVADDGRVAILGGQPATPAVIPSQPQPNPIRWRGTLLFLASLGVLTFLGLLVLGMIVG